MDDKKNNNEKTNKELIDEAIETDKKWKIEVDKIMLVNQQYHNYCLQQAEIIEKLTDELKQYHF
tara:strand:- start:2591 stop:2782 length:192 start_codon:yes stop_codon:yes gene_type:complete